MKRKKCCVPKCGSNIDDGVSFYCFPPNVLAFKWLEKINCRILEALPSHELRKFYVCEKHFESKCIVYKGQIAPGSYPTLFTRAEIISGIPGAIKIFKCYGSQVKKPRGRICEICGVRDAHNSDPNGIYMAKFPSDEELCKQWVKITGLKSLAALPIAKVHKHKYICINHFTANDFDDSGNIYHDAVPSLRLSRMSLSDEMYSKYSVIKENSKQDADHCMDGVENLPSSKEEKDLSVCVICLRADRNLQPIEETLITFYSDMSHHKLTEDMLIYCSECKTTLQKCYNFKRKCMEATRLLTVWDQCCKNDRPPKKYLHDVLGPSMLDVWSRKNIGMYYYNNYSDTPTNKGKFEFKVTKAESGEIDSMVMVTNTNPSVVTHTENNAVTTFQDEAVKTVPSEAVTAKSPDRESVINISDNATNTDSSDDESVIMNNIASSIVGTKSPVKLTVNNSNRIVDTKSPVKLNTNYSNSIIGTNTDSSDDESVIMNDNASSIVGTKSPGTLNVNNANSIVGTNTDSSNDESVIMNGNASSIVGTKSPRTLNVNNSNSIVDTKYPVNLTMNEETNSTASTSLPDKLINNTNSIVEESSPIKFNTNSVISTGSLLLKLLTNTNANSILGRTPVKFSMNETNSIACTSSPIKLLLNKKNIIGTSAPVKLIMNRKTNKIVGIKSPITLASSKNPSNVGTSPLVKLLLSKKADSTVGSSSSSNIHAKTMKVNDTVDNSLGEQSTDLNRSTSKTNIPTSKNHFTIQKDTSTNTSKEAVKDNSLIFDATPSNSNEMTRDPLEIEPKTEPPIPKSVFEYIKNIAGKAKKERKNVKVVVKTKTPANNVRGSYVKINKGMITGLMSRKEVAGFESNDIQRNMSKHINILQMRAQKKTGIPRNNKPKSTEPVEDKQIVTYETLKENHVIVKEVVHITPAKRKSIENKYTKFKKLKTLVELSNIDITQDIQEDCQVMETNDNGVCEEITTNVEEKADITDDDEIDRDERNESDGTSDCSTDVEIPPKIPKMKIKNKLKKIFKKYREIPATADGYRVKKNFILCFYENMSDDDIWKLQEVLKRVKLLKNVFPLDLLNVLAELQQKCESRYVDLFDSIHLDTEEEILREFENRKTYPKYIQSEYKCTLCHTPYHYKRLLEIHMEYHSPSFGKYECDICHLRRTTSYKLNRHRRTHQVVFKCKICTFISNMKPDILKHSLEHQGHAMIVCEVCGNTYNSRKSYTNHKHKQHNHFLCELCANAFVSQVTLDTHKRIKHANINIMQVADRTFCEQCNVVFASRFIYNRHAAKAHGDKVPRFTFNQQGNAGQKVTSPMKKNLALDQGHNVMDQTHNVIDQTHNARVQILSVEQIANASQILYAVGGNELNSSIHTTYVIGQEPSLEQTDIAEDQTNDTEEQTNSIYYQTDDVVYQTNNIEYQTEDVVYQTDDIVYQTDDIVSETVDIVDQSDNFENQKDIVMDQTHNVNQSPIVIDQAFRNSINAMGKRVKSRHRSRGDSANYSGNKSPVKRSQDLQQKSRVKNVKTHVGRYRSGFTSYLDQALDQYSSKDMPHLSD